MRALMVVLALASIAMIPGPCTFNPSREWNCDLGNPCPENFACADDGFCKSADVACDDEETLCSLEDRERVGHCVERASFDTDRVHCGSCFNRCEGAATCVDGACVGEPEAGACVAARGNYDCAQGDSCVDDVCTDGEGPGPLLSLCDDATDCAGGLCERGVCTQPCDFGCPFGYRCDEGAIPGGICAPVPCSDDPLVCANGLVCSARDDVCVPAEFASCANTKSASPWLALLLLGVIALRSTRVDHDGSSAT